MLKIIGIILLVIILAIVLVPAARDYISNFPHHEKKELSEKEIIGDTAGYNPRLKEAQEMLKAIGFNPGVPDGFMGGQTRQAIKKFQKKKRLAATGKINYNTWTALLREKENPKLTSQEKTAAKSAASQSVYAFVKLKEEPLKVEAKEAKKTASPQTQATDVSQAKDKTMQIQLALEKAGFYKGKLDGKMGIQVKMAIRRFQKAKGLKVDGVVGKRTWEELNKYLKN